MEYFSITEAELWKYISKKVGVSLYLYRGVCYRSGMKLLEGVYQYEKGRVSWVFPFLKNKYINDFGSYGSGKFFATEEDTFYVVDDKKILTTPKYILPIKEVWYKRLWAIVSFIILAAASSCFLIYLQFLKTHERNKLLLNTIKKSIILENELNTVRENVAQDFHDELGNKLAGITVLSEMMMRDKELQKTKSINMVSQVRKDAKDLYFGIKDFVWAIDSNSDNLKELLSYLIDFGEELFQNKGIIFKVEKKELEEHIKLPHYWSRQLVLLFKEAMTNCLKHAQATAVMLSFSTNKDILTITFTDNGKGFVAKDLKRKNGLVNMQKRAKKIGGKLSIQSQNGTIVSFTGKMDNAMIYKG